MAGRARFAAAVALLTLLAVLRVASTHGTFSATVDEPIHLASGFDLLRGVTPLDLTHPPLARALAAVPFGLAGDRTALTGGNMVDRGNQLLYDGDYAENLARGRRPLLLLLVVAIVASALLARRVLGAVAAIAGTAILTTQPLLLAHAGLITTDLALVAAVAVGLLALDRFIERPTRGRAVLLGLALGVGLLTKFSFLLFFPAAAFAWIVVRVPLARPSPRALGGLLGAIALGVLLLWGGYRFEVGRPVEIRAATPDHFEWVAPAPLKPFARRLASMTIPAPSLAAGIAELQLHSIAGHRAFFLGEVRQTGWWNYFPVVLFYKTPIPVILLFAWGVWCSVRQRNRGALALAAAGTAILLVAMTGSINIGVRHVLPVVIPISLVAGLAVVEIWRSERQFGRAALVALLVWLFAGTAASHPDYLGWFNEASGEPSQIAVDSNLDWGQDVLRLGEVARQRGIEKLYFALPTCTRIGVHVPMAEPLPPHVPVRGWVAVGESTLRLDRDAYAWLSSYRPVQKIGTSIRLYEIP